MNFLNIPSFHFVLVSPISFPEKSIRSQDLCWTCHYRINLNAKLHRALHTQTEPTLWMLQPLGTSPDGSCPKHLEHFTSGNPHPARELLGAGRALPMGWGSLLCFNPPETLLSYWILLVLPLHFKEAFFPLSFGCSSAQRPPTRTWAKSGCSLKCTR